MLLPFPLVAGNCHVSPPEGIIKHLHAVSATAGLRDLSPAWSFGCALLRDWVMTRKRSQPNSSTFLLRYNHEELATQCFYNG